VKWNAFLSGLCGVAAALGLMAASASADVTTERGASILAFPKVIADGTADTVIQITNVSNSMVHAHCYYVNAQLANPSLPEGPFNQPLWQETDFTIWLTKQQPTHWQVSTGRFVDPTDSCFDGNEIDPAECANAGIDPGAVPPVPDDFIGELKCVEVDAAGNPIGGNHLKGEATIKTGTDVAKYNGVGIQGTELAGGTGNTLLLDQPSDTDDPIGQYNACPNVLIVNHFAEGVTDPVVLANDRGGNCAGGPNSGDPCVVDDDCPESSCTDGSNVGIGGDPLTSATLTDLTLVPCSQDFENQIPGRVTVQFLITNEFEQRFSASTTVACWKNFFLHQVDSATAPDRSVFSYNTLGTTVAQTRVSPVDLDGGLIGIAGVVRADEDSNRARTALNLHIEGDRFSATGGEVVDQIILIDQ
jgi:hypothetical protein